MTRIVEVQTNLASGELDPTLRGHTDLKAYANGASRVRQMWRRATGGMERRPGTYDLNGMAGDARMAEFEFSDSQRYALAFSQVSIAVFDLNGVLLQTIVSPYTTPQCYELNYTQLGDVMIITHQSVATRVLRRLSATTFSLTLYAFDVSVDGNTAHQPYFKFAPATTSITPSAATGVGITLTASAAVFDALHVGQRIRVYDTDVLITGFTSATILVGTVQGTIKAKLDLDPFKTSIGSGVVEVLHLFHGLVTGSTITLSGANAVAGITAANLTGAFVVTVIDELRYSITTAGAATSSEDGGGTAVAFAAGGTATRTWMEPAISPLRGYPGACAFHEGRLWLGGTPSQPDAEFGSQANFQIFNFDVGKGYDAESVQVQSGSEDVSRVRHLISNGDLQIFTATQEAVFVTRDGEAITPNNARVKGQSDMGSGGVQPVVFDGATLFVQENGLSVSELAYSESQSGYVPVAVSTLAGHLIRKPKSMASSVGSVHRSEQLAYVVNDDGTVAVFHSSRAEGVAGWGLWTMGAGLVRSACAIGPYVFFCVFVRGVYRLYRLADVQIIQLDGAVLHTDVAKTTWTLDARVRNRTVSIVTELGYHGDYAVPVSGIITLTVPVTQVVAGDPFYFELETLPPVVQLPSGQRVGLIQRIVRSIINFDDCNAATVNGERVETRNAGDDFAGAVSPVTGPYEARSLGFSRNPTTVISQDEPLFCRVLSITQEVKV